MGWIKTLFPGLLKVWNRRVWLTLGLSRRGVGWKLEKRRLWKENIDNHIWIEEDANGSSQWWLDSINYYLVVVLASTAVNILVEDRFRLYLNNSTPAKWALIRKLTPSATSTNWRSESQVFLAAWLVKIIRRWGSAVGLISPLRT